MDAATLQAEAERQAREGLRGPHPFKPQCIKCAQPFKFGREIDGANVYTLSGARETQISELCESCFDAIFSEDEDNGL